MASEWVTFRLGDACTKIGSGATPRGGSSVYLDQGEFALIRSQNIYNHGFHHDGLAYLTKQQADDLSNVEVDKDDVLLTITGDSVARSCQVDPDILPARVNQHVAIIRPDPTKLAPRFLRFFLVSPAMQSHMLSLAGAGDEKCAHERNDRSVRGASTDQYCRSTSHCVHTCALDDKIELNRRRNRTLEAMARSIFQSWFVDFEPVHAKAAGRKPNGLSKELAALFSDSFENSEFGDIPKGWRVGVLADVAEIVMGSSPPGSSYNDDGIGTPLVNGPVEFGDYFAEKRKWTTQVTRLSERNDLIFCVRGSTTGRRVVADDVYCLGRGVCAIRAKDKVWAFVHQLMRSELAQLLRG